MIMIQEILSVLPGNHPWQNTLICKDCVPSTNDLAKEMARNGAPSGTVIVATGQTAGRGRLGRSFHAPAGLGLYLSLILRPDCGPEQLLHLTCAAAVAACDSVSAMGICPKIKWTNDLVCGTRKLGGILTELSVRDGKVDWAVIGIGINCLQKQEDFPEELQNMATSLFLESGNAVSPAHLAGHLILQLSEMDKKLLSDQTGIMDRYRSYCMTTGQQVVLLRGDERRYGTALRVENDGGLTVQFQDGCLETVQSGEISVRGMYGYV